MIRMGVVGFGYWGPNLARNIAQCEETALVAIADLDAGKRDSATRLYPYIDALSDAEELFARDDVDAVVIATPLASHYALAKAALDAGKHVIVEKPMAGSTAEAAELRRVAEARGLVLLVDHTFIYSGAVAKMRDLVAGGELGDLFYFDSTRINLGLFQHDTNVIWDLAVHDLSILFHVLDSRPIAVSANGVNHFPDGHENIAYLTLFFPDQMIAHINVNWLAPVKVRKILIGGSKRMIVFDDMEPSEKVKVYDRGVDISEAPEDIYRMLVSYRSGDMWAPKLDQTEALATEIRHFAACIRGESRPLTGPAMGEDVVRVLEAASLSMRRRGAAVEIAGDVAGEGAVPA